MQPVSSPQWSRISGTTAGTTTFATAPASLHSITIPANKTGTVNFYDVAAAAGTAATNEVFSVPCTVGTIPTTVKPELQFRKGLIAVWGGTVDMTIGWE